MPECYKEIIDPGIDIALWQITESERELTQGLTLSAQAQKRLSMRKSNMHRKGYLAIRQLLKKYDIAPQLHQYEANGAPYLTDGRFLSISHTKNVAAVAIAKTPVGIDVEYYQNKIVPIALRFLHPNEREQIEIDHQIEQYTKIWTAKEAIYKVFNTPGIHFANQIFINAFQWGATKGQGTLFHNGVQHPFNLHFFEFKDYCVTLANPKKTST
jgi:4'-phosphopantetheinyl transferase